MGTAACNNCKKLAKAFGDDWTKQVLIPEINRMRSNNNYLYRLTALCCIEKLSETVSAQITTDLLLPNALALAEDGVPNVRFNVAKCLEKVSQNLESVGGTKVKPTLQSLTEDPDQDVRYHSHRALQTL